jgi:hypothetical protein
MKELGIVLKSKTITIDEITLPMIIINLLQDSSTLRALKLNKCLAKEQSNTLDATKHTRTLDAKYAKSRSPVNCKEQLQASKCRPSEKKLLQRLLELESLSDGTLGDWKY